MNIWIKLFIFALNNLKYGKLKLSIDEKRHLISGNLPGPNADLKIKNKDIIKKILIQGSVTFGEEYVNGNIKTSNLENLLSYFAVNNDEVEKNIKYNLLFKIKNKLNHYFNKNTKKGSKKNISSHYDLGNNFYKIWLDKSMTYSSAIFKNETDALEIAQKNKYNQLLNLAEIKDGDKVLEIGSGWGGFVSEITSYLNCKITTTTISEEQYKYVKSKFLKIRNKNLTILKKDYRDLSGQFDKIISIEMFEAVGKEFWNVYFKKLKSLLNQNGIIVLQIITIKDNAFDYYNKNPDFIQKHIFPGGMLPSVNMLKKVLENNKLKIIENNNYAEHYAKTLNNWRNSFNSSLNKIKDNGFDDRFIRLWNYYLAYCESGFKTKRIGLNQIKIMHN
ncbi:MAG: class I SAM-dependent methyltransferase [Alphaproteobacteria bacterium]|nr:MAG: class I SAM-dependent methyltransferase [Alphaproteobacteria bacterium]